MTGQHSKTRERAASAAQYVLLGGFASVAAGISAQGLTGFARSNMQLRGPWPYLLFFALDGAAGVCAVLLARRAARAESGLAPRMAVWGLVAASSTFNWTHAPHRPAAPEAFGLMPVIAAVLFEFCLRELRLRTLADRSGRKPSPLRWLHPAERLQAHICMAADNQIPAEAATRHVRINHAARRLHQLRAELAVYDQSPAPSAMTTRRVRRAEHHAHRALTRAGFADPAIAAAILRQVQVLTMTTTLARLDYHAPDEAQQAIANLIASPCPARPQPDADPAQPVPRDGVTGDHAIQDNLSAAQVDGHPAGNPTPEAPRLDGGRDAQLVAAATRIILDALRTGDHLSQAALAAKLRSEGYTVANNRLRWLSSVSGLGLRPATEPDSHPGAGQ